MGRGHQESNIWWPHVVMEERVMGTKQYAPSLTLPPASVDEMNQYLQALPKHERHGARSRFLQEAVTLALLRHRNNHKITQMLENFKVESDQSNWWDNFREAVGG